MSRRLRVAYLMRYLPAPTETFVLDEAAALRASGAWVQTWMLDRDSEAVRHGRHESFYSAARVVPRPSSVRCVLSSLGMETRANYPQVHQNWVRHARMRDLRRVAWLAGSWKRARIDVVRVHHAAETARYAVAAALLARLPVSLAVHARDLFVPVPDLSWILRASNHVTTITPFHRDRLLRLGLPSQRVELLACPVAIPDQVVSTPASDGPLRILSVGRLIAKKGHDLTLEACGALARSGVQVEITLVGDGRERETLTDFADVLSRDTGGALKVDLVGMKSAEWIENRLERSRYHAAVLACRVDREGDRDGVPVALLEAQARGLPVVTSALPGFDFEFSAEGGAVLLPLYDRAGAVEPSAGDLVACLGALYNDPAYQRRLAQAARLSAEERMSWEQTGLELQRMLLGLCSNMLPPGAPS
ncbi:MAG: hypothetical protein CL928_08890 [Deltaproteobacteria bacterium]|nr:hypothetical protein [Deltaproteobacteria bacterium]